MFVLWVRFVVDAIDVSMGMLKVARPIFDEGENSVHFYGKSPS